MAHQDQHRFAERRHWQEPAGPAHRHRRRLENKIAPDVPVEQFGQVEKALKIADQYDLLIFDGSPHSTQATIQPDQQEQRSIN